MKWRSANSTSGTLASLAADPAPQRKPAGHPPVKLSDEQILEARRLHQDSGWTVKRLLEHFGLPLTNGRHFWMRSVLRYELRSSPSKPLDPRLLLRSR